MKEITGKVVDAEIAEEVKLPNAPSIVTPGSIGEAIANEQRLIVKTNKQIAGLKATILAKQDDVKRSHKVIKQLEAALKIKTT